MTNRITDKELINITAKNTETPEDIVIKIYEALFEEISQNLDRCRIVTIRNFGTFYIKTTAPTRTFKFNPSRRLRKSLGWSVK